MREERNEKVRYIDRRGLQTGVVTLIKVIEPTEKLDRAAEVIANIEGKKIVAVNIRKIVFEENRKIGTDIFYKFSTNQPYSYKIIDTGLANSISDYANNTLCIRHVRDLSDVLFYAGFPDEVDASDIRDIKKIVMSKDKFLRIKSHKVHINASGVIDLERIRDINNQAVSLDNFRKMLLPTRPRRIEKVYAKYFK